MQGQGPPPHFPENSKWTGRNNILMMLTMPLLSYFISNFMNRFELAEQHGLMWLLGEYTNLHMTSGKPLECEQFAAAADRSGKPRRRAATSKTAPVRDGPLLPSFDKMQNHNAHKSIHASWSYWLVFIR